MTLAHHRDEIGIEQEAQCVIALIERSGVGGGLLNTQQPMIARQ